MCTAAPSLRSTSVGPYMTDWLRPPTFDLAPSPSSQLQRTFRIVMELARLSGNRDSDAPCRNVASCNNTKLHYGKAIIVHDNNAYRYDFVYSLSLLTSFQPKHHFSVAQKAARMHQKQNGKAWVHKGPSPSLMSQRSHLLDEANLDQLIHRYTQIRHLCPRIFSQKQEHA